MKTIQIAPYDKDCKVIGHKITGTMNGRTFVYDIPSEYEVYSYQHEYLIKCFCAAIALASKPWQVTNALNEQFGIEGGKFYEK